MGDPKIVSLSNRMRAYGSSGPVLLPRTPVVVEIVPVKSQLARKPPGPLPDVLRQVCGLLDNAVFGYTDFSSATVVLADYPEWSKFAFRDPQTVSSVTASFASVASGGAVFRARSFNVPKDEVSNYFVWKQMSLAIALMGEYKLEADQESVKEFILNGPRSPVLRFTGTWWRGRACSRVASPCDRDSGQTWFWDVDDNVPVFSADRGYVTSHVYPGTD